MNLLYATDRRRWRQLSIALAVGAGLGLSLPAFASRAELPMTKHEGKVTYLSGGIGADEAQAMRSAAPQYPLEVEFIKKEASGPAAYLADDHVTIRDHAGKTVLNTTSGGPYLLAKLPAGWYTVSASNHNISKERRIDVTPDKHERIVFEW